MTKNKAGGVAFKKASGPEYLKFMALFFLLLYGSGNLSAQVPLKVNFQGRLVERGMPVNDQRSFIFKIYDALTGGNLLWTSQTQNVTVASGVFSVVLQTGTPVNLSSATFSGPRYISVSVAGVTLNPRQEMLSVPYALVAQSLSADALIDPSNVGAGVLGPNVIVSSIAVNAVSSTSIKDAAVTFVKISSTGCLGGNVMKRNLDNTAWVCAVDDVGAVVLKAVSLAPDTYDIDSSVNPSIYINDIGGGNLLELRHNDGVKFTVDTDGNAFFLGYSSATKYYGDGSMLTGISVPGDNLGNHVATTTLNMSGFPIVNMPSLGLANNIVISSETSAALGAGVRISSNVYIVGFSSAAKYYGDGSMLTGLGAATADNLGNHTATKDLNMNGFNIVNAASGTFTQGITASSFTATGIGLRAAQLLLADNVIISSETGAARGGGVNISSNVYIVGFSSAGSYYGGSALITGLITAGYYQVNGSTVLAILEGAGSLGVGVDAGPMNTGNYNVFVGSAAGYSNTLGGGNSFVGFKAGYNTVTGAANTIFGSEAGSGAPAGSFSNDTLMGYQAGFGLTTGGENIFVGYKAGYTVTTGTGNIVIGYNENPTSPAANNEINIGGVYKGNISSGMATIPKFTVRSVSGDATAAFGETLTVNAAADVTVTLPAVTAADIGATVTVIKLGTGKVTVAANGTPIADSAASGTIYNSAFFPPYASLTLRLADAGRWGIVSGDGAWITTAP